MLFIIETKIGCLLIKKYFYFSLDLLNVFYGEKKEKSEIASLCKTLSELAKDGDDLSRWIFNEAGKELAKFIQSLYPGASKVSLFQMFCFIQLLIIKIKIATLVFSHFI